MAKPRRLSYSGQAPAATAGAVDDTLCNRGVTPASFGGGQERYQAVLLEQYKLYVEMADRVSARRALANTFFLTLNTAPPREFPFADVTSHSPQAFEPGPRG